MRKLDCAYVRLVDVAAALLWLLSISLLVADHFTALGQPGWLTRYSVMLGLLAMCATMASIAGWMIRELTIASNVEAIDELLDRRRTR